MRPNTPRQSRALIPEQEQLHVGELMLTAGAEAMSHSESMHRRAEQGRPQDNCGTYRYVGGCVRKALVSLTSLQPANLETRVENRPTGQRCVAATDARSAMDVTDFVAVRN